MPKAVQTLSSGPIDVIGDIHGELDALNMLLDRLGYDQFGRHPQNRTLVFLGDLVDRGPNSPGVVEKISGLYFAKRAQCILGNHELRLLNQIQKPDNSWTSREMANRARKKGWEAPMKTAHTLQLRSALTFFYELPIALMRSDLRLIHACWDTESIQTLPDMVGSWSSLFARYRRNASKALKEAGWTRKRISQLKSNQALHDENNGIIPDGIPNELTHYFVMEQNLNPIKVLTQGLQAPLLDQPPFWSGYRWQLSDRFSWWNEYQDEVPVIFGHYWRPKSGQYINPTKPPLFEGVHASSFLGPHQNCFCLDFAVGLRFQERLEGKEPPFQGELAALRIPEEGSHEPWQLFFDQGDVFALNSPYS
jgi:hypothetical protein